MGTLYFNSTTNEGQELSNFHYAPFTLPLKIGNFTFNYAENAYQLLKSPLITTQQVTEFQRYDPLTAKRKGATMKRRSDWNETRIKAMEYVLSRKITNPEFRAYLKNTGDRALVHFSPWDIFWGVDKQDQGENHLGKILMKLRAGIV